MKVGVVCETSSADRNADILSALEGRGHEIINAGMTEKGKEPELSYIHAGFLAATLLNLKKADFVVLDKDPYEVGGSGLKNLNIEATVFEGQVFPVSHV